MFWETTSRSSNPPASKEGEEERNSKAQVERAGKHAADRKEGGVVERRVVEEAARSNTQALAATFERRKRGKRESHRDERGRTALLFKKR